VSTEGFKIAGRRLGDVEPDLLTEFVDYLCAGNISPVGYVPEDAELATLSEQLALARISRRCECGQMDCRTYYFDVPTKTHAVSYYTVRFYARGEAMLHIDSDGDIYQLERLTDLSLDASRTIYAKRPDGSWESKRL
jgi:hypothetical protein